jgi:hypothetical protein
MIIISYYIDKKNRLFEVTNKNGLIKLKLIWLSPDDRLQIL